MDAILNLELACTCGLTTELVPLVEVSGIKSGSPLLSFNKEVGTVKEIQITEPRIVAGNQPGEKGYLVNRLRTGY